MASESDPEMNGLNGSGDAGAKVDSQLVAKVAPTVAQPGRRRAMLRTVSVAAPVVMTLASNPVSASTCVVASSFVSALAMASRHPTSSTPCSGKTPSGWKSTGSSWPSPYCGQATRTTPMTNFKSVFSTCTGTSLTNTSTLMDGLGGVTGQYGQLANYCVAALLNAQSNKVSSSVLTAAQVIQLWKDMIANGYYKPSASSSVKFNAAQTVTWLASMMA